MPQVDQSWVSVFDAAPDVVLCVDQDHPAASDTNPATPALPLNTISAAVALAKAHKRDGASTQVLISPAVYREEVTLRNVAGPAFIILEGIAPGVEIAGSDVSTSWTPEEGDIWSTPWTQAWGLLPWPSRWPAGEDIVRRREMVFNDGQLLRQFLSYDELVAGSFFVDETTSKIFAWPIDGLGVMEVATKKRNLWIQNTDYVQVKNISMRHCTPEAVGGGNTAALSIYNSHHVMLDGATVRDTNNVGLAIWEISDCVFRNIGARDAGMMGMTAGRVKDSIFEGVTLSANNWRGDWGGFRGWSTGGTKVSHNHRVIHRDYVVSGNFARGFWADTDLVDVSIENIECHSNLNDNMLLEAVQGPIRIDGAYLWNSRMHGLVTRNVSNLTLRDTHIRDNAAGQFVISGQRNGRNVPNWQTGESKLCLPVENWTWEGLFLHGPSPLLKEGGEFPGKGIAGSWEDTPGMVARGVHFFKG